MRNKFSEWIEQGIAPFHHEARETDTMFDPITQTYNKFWGLATDTCMSVTEAGRRIISGSLISDTSLVGQHKKNRLKYCYEYNNVDFRHSGFHNLVQFLEWAGLCIKPSSINSQFCWECVPMADGEICVGRNCEIELAESCDSLMPVYSNMYEKTPGAVVSVINNAETLPDIINQMNESNNVIGDDWWVDVSSGGNVVYSKIGNQTIILEMNGIGQKFECPELDNLLKINGLEDIFLISQPNGRGYYISSNDPKWLSVLRKKNCKITNPEFRNASPDEKFQVIQNMINSIS